MDRENPRDLARRLMSREQAADYIGVSLTSLKEHVQPHLRHVEVGRRILFPVEEINRWVDDQMGSESDGKANRP